jgi:CheY-like chemotaxis protein/prolyl-tRNA editing enzyme YbaK/EbsC (Cys-tRNA(Pro) deacylase)
MSIPRWLKQILDYHHVPYEERRHPPVFTASQLAHAEHVSGYHVAKTVFVNCDGRPVAVVLPACARLDLERVRGVLGGRELRFASEEEIAGWFAGCQPGAVPPLRLRADECILMDRALGRLGKMLFAAGTQQDAVIVPFREWYRAVRPGVGRFTAEENGNGHAPPTVLVVEDEADTNQLLCQLLERQGLVCRGAAEGREGLVLAGEMRPSAILLDLMLPDLSGFEVYEQLRRNSSLRHIPVIVVTALDDEKARQRGCELGADAYLTKPFLPDKLVAELRCALEDARA